MKYGLKVETRDKDNQIVSQVVEFSSKQAAHSYYMNRIDNFLFHNDKENYTVTTKYGVRTVTRKHDGEIRLRISKLYGDIYKLATEAAELSDVNETLREELKNKDAALEVAFNELRDIRMTLAHCCTLSECDSKRVIDVRQAVESDPNTGFMFNMLYRQAGLGQRQFPKGSFDEFPDPLPEVSNILF